MKRLGRARRIAFVTWSGEPDLNRDDRLAAEACRARGIAVDARPWDIPCDWSSYDAIVLRTTWNYHRAEESFTRWIAQLEASQAPVWNPPSVLRWNMHKRYLLDLRARGVHLPETVIVSRNSRVELSSLLRERGWPAAVVKPAVSANAFQTECVSAADAHRAQSWFDAALVERDMLVQRFLPEILEGELSLIFFRGRFSHAVKKRARAGEFRVQEHHGGEVRPHDPDRQTIDYGARMLTHLPGPTLYARVDGIATPGAFVLLEIEVIEPSLFFAHDFGAAARFAAAV